MLFFSKGVDTMNESILTVLALAPGFVGIAVNKLLTADTRAEPLGASTLKYFLYSAASFLMVEASTLATPIRKTLKEQPVGMLEILLPIAASVIIGILWTIWLKNALVKVANKFLQSVHRDGVDLNESPLQTLFEEHRPYFVSVILPNGETKEGAVLSVDAHSNTILLAPEPSWTKDNDMEREDKQTLIYLNTGAVIIEYTFKYKQ